jgi:hypothetical protein
MERYSMFRLQSHVGHSAKIAFFDLQRVCQWSWLRPGACLMLDLFLALVDDHAVEKAGVGVSER